MNLGKWPSNEVHTTQSFRASFSPHLFGREGDYKIVILSLIDEVTATFLRAVPCKATVGKVPEEILEHISHQLTH